MKGKSAAPLLALVSAANVLAAPTLLGPRTGNYVSVESLAPRLQSESYGTDLGQGMDAGQLTPLAETPAALPGFLDAEQTQRALQAAVGAQLDELMPPSSSGSNSAAAGAAMAPRYVEAVTYRLALFSALDRFLTERHREQIRAVAENNGITLGELPKQPEALRELRGRVGHLLGQRVKELEAETSLAPLSDLELPSDGAWVPYFAYGSNLRPSQMEHRCPGSRPMCLAELRGWKFIINSFGWANIVPSPGGAVYGKVWALSPANEKSMDSNEGVAFGVYSKERLRLGDMRVLLYAGVNQEHGSPVAGYLERIADWAGRHGFPGEYVAYLRSWLPKKDPAALEGL